LLAASTENFDVNSLVGFGLEQHSVIEVTREHEDLVASIPFTLWPSDVVSVENPSFTWVLQFYLNGDRVGGLDMLGTDTACGWKIEQWTGLFDMILEEHVQGCNCVVSVEVTRMGVTNLLEARMLGMSVSQHMLMQGPPVVSKLHFVPLHSNDDGDDNISVDVGTVTIVYLFLTACEQKMVPDACVQDVQRMSPVLRGVSEVRIFFAFVMPHEVALQIKEATGCLCQSCVSFVGIVRDGNGEGEAFTIEMDSIQSPNHGIIIIMEDSLDYPHDYIQVVTEKINIAENTMGGRIIIGQEGYVLSEAVESNVKFCYRETELAAYAQLVHVLRLGTIAFLASIDSHRFINSILCLLEFPIHMRHAAFAFLAGEIEASLLLWPSITHFADDASWQLQTWSPSDSIFRFQASDLSTQFNCNTSVKGWQVDSSAWTVWLRRSFSNVALASLLANVPAVSTHLDISADKKATAETSESGSAFTGMCDERIWNIPVSVMSQPHDHARRESTQHLLREIGFRNVTFAPTIKWKDMDLNHLLADGLLSGSLFHQMETQNDTNQEGYIKYAANALSQIQRIKAAAAADEPVIIMEDDLMAGASMEVIRENICSTLSDLPKTADLVYLEYCFETCVNLTYNKRYPRLAKAFRPSCAAAILFTAKGARLVADLCLPVFDVIDRMYPALIRAGWLEAYLMTPAVFYQVIAVVYGNL